jgi:hypothetical protein
MEEWSLATYPPTDRRNGGMVGYSVSKNRRRPLQGRQRGILGKLVVLQYSLALTSIFIIKVNFPPNTDILTYVHDTNQKNISCIINLVYSPKILVNNRSKSAVPNRGIAVPQGTARGS